MKPFTDTLNALRFGTLTDDLTEELHKLTGNVLKAHRIGKITLTLTLRPGKAGQIEIFDDIKTTQPKEERGSSIMFATPDGNLQREDPRQMELKGLRQVDKETGEIKQVPAPSVSTN